MRRLAKEELRETKQYESKRAPSDSSVDEGVQPHAEPAETVDQSTGVVPTHQNDGDFEVPKHETETAQDSELEKSRRTVFLSNVSSEAIKSKTAHKTLMTHLSSFLEELPTSKPPHRIESLRFRSVAFESVGIPKKASFATKELKDSTTKATNAYVVYSSEQAARKACQKLNGTVVLWREFGKVGTVENVRVIRDKKTRVGKGIAYVQFKVWSTVQLMRQFCCC